MKKLIALALVLLGLGAVVMTAGSDWAFRRIWLPKLAEAAGVEATVTRVEWSPLSSLTLHGLEFQRDDGTRGKFETVRVDYHPGRIRRKAVALDRLSLAGGELRWVERAGPPAPAPAAPAVPAPVATTTPAADTNVTPAVEAPRERERPARPPSRKRSRGFDFDPGQVSLTNVIVRADRADGSRVVAAVDSLHVDSIRRDRTNVIAAAGVLSGEPLARMRLERARFETQCQFALTPDQHVREARGRMSFTDIAGRHGSVTFSNYQVVAEGEVAGYRLKPSTLLVTRGDRTEARVRVGGPFDWARRDADLLAQVDQVSPELANVFLGRSPVAVDSGGLAGAGQVRVTRDGTRLQAELRMDRLTLHARDSGETMPVIDGTVQAAGEYFPGRRELQLDRAEARLKQGQKPLLDAVLSKPVRLGRGGGTGGAEFQVRLAPMDLASFRPLWSRAQAFQLAAGNVSGSGIVAVSADAQRISWDLHLGGADLVGDWRGTRVERGVLELALVGSVEGFDLERYDRLDLTRATLVLRDASGVRASLEVRGRGDTNTGQFTATAAGDAALLLPWGEGTDGFRSGTVQGDASLGWTRPGARAGQFKLAGTGLTGRWNALRVDNGSARVSGELGVAGDRVSLRAVQLDVEPAPGTGEGSVTAVADWSRTTNTWDARATLSGWTRRNLTVLLSEPLAGVEFDVQGLDGEWRAGRTAAGSQIGAKLIARGLRAVSRLQPGADQVAPVTATLDFEASGMQRLEVKSASLDLGPAGKLEAVGWWRDARAFDLTLTGGSVDLAPLSGFILREPPEDKPARQETAKSSGSSPSGAGSRAGAVSAAAAPPAPEPRRPEAKPAATRGAAPDRRLSVKLDALAIPEYGTFRVEATGQENAAGLRVSPLEIKAGDAVLAGSLSWNRNEKGAPFLMGVRADRFPLEAFRAFAGKKARPWFTGRVTCDGSFRGAGGSWKRLQESLAGRMELDWTDARLERVPPIRSLLKTISKQVNEEFKEAKFPRATATVTVDQGLAQTDNLRVDGDLLRFALAGNGTLAGELDLGLVFIARTEVLKRGQVKVGPVTIGGEAFAGFGKANGDYTTMPGRLPLRGELGGDVEADWTGWLVGVGIGNRADADALKGLIEAFAKPKDEKKKKKK